MRVPRNRELSAMGYFLIRFDLRYNTDPLKRYREPPGTHNPLEISREFICFFPTSRGNNKSRNGFIIYNLNYDINLLVTINYFEMFEINREMELNGVFLKYSLDGSLQLQIDKKSFHAIRFLRQLKGKRGI